MPLDDPLSELWQIKEAISTRFSTAHELVAEADRIARKEPLPPPRKSRKLIEGFPRGKSVDDEDEIMRELRAVRAKLLEEAGGDLGTLLERANREAPLIIDAYRKAAQGGGRSPKVKPRKRPAKRTPPRGVFRSAKSISSKK